MNLSASFANDNLTNLCELELGLPTLSILD